MYQISIANSSYILPTAGKSLRFSHIREWGEAMATSPAVNPTMGIEIRGAMQPGYDSILTPDALEFVAELTRRFGDRVTTLLDARAARQRQLDGGALPDFLPETRSVREGNWRVTSIPADLQDRRVEITGPTDRKMIINALN